MLFKINSDIAPTGRGPQPYNMGRLHCDVDQQASVQHWQKVRESKRGWELNQSYPRRPMSANPGFYTFWPDGKGRKPSKLNLYFSDKNGNVFMLPDTMNKFFMKPQRVFNNK